ncbi:hypothetical protein BC830DRAFT_430995 [Chytriomyces sp. MP71]|nr:hypothetical protein BC830DRAFT_430995 [Chytriomyces sp. MP71]
MVAMRVGPIFGVHHNISAAIPPPHNRRVASALPQMPLPKVQINLRIEQLPDSIIRGIEPPQHPTIRPPRQHNLNMIRPRRSMHPTRRILSNNRPIRRARLFQLHHASAQMRRREHVLNTSASPSQGAGEGQIGRQAVAFATALRVVVAAARVAPTILDIAGRHADVGPAHHTVFGWCKSCGR